MTFIGKTMIRPSIDEFKALSTGVKLVPVHLRLENNQIEPARAFARLKDQSKEAYLLESALESKEMGRYSYVGFNPLVRFSSQAEEIMVTDHQGQQRALQGNPFTLIEEVMEEYRPAILEELSPFTGTMVGYIGYDCIRHVEEIPRTNPDPLGLPESALIFPKNVLFFDHHQKSLTLIEMTEAGSAEAYERAKANLEIIAQSLLAAEPLSELPRETQEDPRFTSNMTKEEFEAIVNKAKNYVYEGDIFQVVLSQRFEMDYDKDPFLIYRALRQINPSPYLFYLQFEGFQIAGSSPEVLVKKDGETLTLRPIAGTRKRGATPERDRELQEELLNDPKEIAEHMMLVDLGRNDLGRVSQFGSVKPTRFKYIENYSHVMHIVTNLESRVKEGIKPSEILQACFPAGTLSGAPKIRAMEIIEELEVAKRGFYGGTVLHLDYAGNFDSCIGIRSVVIKDRKAYMQAGAGVVADSIPELEYKECINKGRAVLRAIAQCQQAQTETKKGGSQA